ncbi:hypothetical protein BGX30_014376 [Mortierella sp. GBA39]|nr:hypothetical protein BGX30_014376 [Mortierella sp. GBA39]
MDKPLPPMPIVETSTPSSSSSSATMNNINNPASTFPYPQQQHIAGASPLVSTTISFVQGEQYLAGNSGNTSGNANNTTNSRQSLDHAPPPYSFMAGNRGSTIISTGPPLPTEDQLFQIQELSPGPLAVSPLGTGSSAISAITALHQSTQYICADPMHDQQYLLVGSGNALHSIDLTFSNHLQQERQQGGVSSSNSINYTGGGGGVSSVANVVRTHIQGVAFKEIHCLEEIGLVVVIAGRNSRVRCYDYDSINRLVAYGHSAQGRGRVVEGGKLGAVKNMIQLRVETALQRGEDNNCNPSDGPHSSPSSGMTGTSLNRGHRGTAGSTTAPGGGGALPQQQNRHTTSLDRSSLLSPPPAWSDSSPGQPLESIRDDQGATTTTTSCATTSPSPPPATVSSNFKKHKQRPLSLGGLASLAQEHVMRKSTPKDHQPTDAAYNSNSNNKIPSAATTATTNTSNSTPSSPSSATPGVTIGGNGSNNNNNGAAPSKNKRLSQMASYLSQAAVNSNMAAHITNSASQDASPEAVGWAWNFTKLKQTKDVIGLDFHYTATTVFMTVVSKTVIDIYCRPRSTRGRKPPTPSGGGSGGGANGNNNSNGNGSRTSYSGADTLGRSGISSLGGGMATAGATSLENPHFHRDNSQDPYEWRSYKQLYHPEAPSFMTVVKGPTEVTDIILGKGPRACVINVQDMSVTDLHRQETSSVIHGLSKKLGFRNTSLWHSFEKIPFDVPPHILFPAAAEAMYGSSERKGTHSRPLSVYNGGTGSSGYPASGGGGNGSGPQRQSRDNILQRPADQLSIHQQELNEQEREEAAARGLALKLHNVQLQGANGNNNNLGVPYHPNHHRGSSSSSSPPSSPSSTNSSSSIVLPSQQLPTTTPAPPAAATKTKTRMVTSDEVLNLAFSQRTTGQLFLATYGSQSRIVDLQGKPQARIVLDWGESGPSSGSGSSIGCAPQKVEFLKTVHDIYVVGFEKSSIVVFSLTRAKKVKEITKRDLIQATARAQSSASSISVPGSNGQGQQRFLYDGSTQPHQYRSHSPQPPPLPTSQTPTSSPPSGPTNTSASSSLTATALALTNATSTISSSSSASIKFLGRDSMTEDSLGLFFSYCHPKNGVSICQLSVVPLLAPDELELIGYYP